MIKAGDLIEATYPASECEGVQYEEEISRYIVDSVDKKWAYSGIEGCGVALNICKILLTKEELDDILDSKRSKPWIMKIIWAKGLSFLGRRLSPFK